MAGSERHEGQGGSHPPGPLLFSRYAYPPNRLGYCGPPDHQALLEYGAHGVVDGGLLDLAHGFEGPWPYLEMIAGANRIAGPLDARVVEAYWLGNRLLDRVDTRWMGDTLEDRFRGRAGTQWHRVAAAVERGAQPCHAFHVFGVYPWAGLLRSGQTEQPLQVLDRCRIRWGQVVTAAGPGTGGATAVVRCPTLTWDGERIGLGPPATEEVTVHTGGLGFVDDLHPGEWVSLHWDWVCDRLDPERLGALRTYTARQLHAVNADLRAAPAPTA